MGYPGPRQPNIVSKLTGRAANPVHFPHLQILRGLACNNVEAAGYVQCSGELRILRFGGVSKPKVFSPIINEWRWYDESIPW
jgi:hypothetical protein